MSTESEINFAIKFISTLEACKKSTIFSPASILSSLSLIYAGSDALENQFGNLLGKKIDSTNFLKHYSKFVKFCHSTSNLNNCDFKILLPNRLYLSSQKLLQQDFIRAVTAEFSDDVFQQIDFSMIDVPKAKAAKEKVAKKICETINNYVNEKTDGKIRDIIKVEELYSAMNILISSGICIVGKWEQPFNDPVFSTFYSSATSKKTIQMLSKSISPGGCNLTKGNSWKCIGLPYKTRNIWLHILLPNEKDGLSHILENLNYSFIKRCVRSNTTAPVVVRATIPAFEIEESMEITNNLGRSGLTLIFRNEAVNLMFENEEVDVDKIFHKTLINIDKDGSFGYGNSMPSNSSISDVDDAGEETFISDHPFLFFLNSVKDQDPRKMKNILLMGTFC